MQTPKTQKNDGPVNSFLDGITDKQQQTDAKQLARLMQESTGQEPVMWGRSIIGYGTYTYRYASGREGEWFRVGFAPRTKNLTIYLVTGFDEYADVSGYDPRPLLAKLGPHKTAKSCLYIKNMQEIDAAILQQLIKEVYQYSKKQNP